MTSYIPAGSRTLTPYLVMKNAAAAIDFYVSIFGAEELSRMPMPDGLVGHAELRIGDSPFMLADEFPEMGFLGPESIGGSPVTLFIYVEDVDAVYAAAVAAGATVLQPVKDQFYGDRSGTLRDPFGHVWSIGTHIEDVSAEEMDRRYKDLMDGEASQV